jgi:hypothetical protein
MTDRPLVLFKPKLPKLSKSESKVLDLLVEAGKLIVPLYEQQENHKTLGANFYPSRVSKKEIERAAEKDPKILDPYTVVEKRGGKLVTIPYHEKYAQLLKPIADKLIQAAKITDNKEFSKRLSLQAKSLLDGSYNEASKSWMSMKHYILDIVIGPIERYDDKLFFVKTSYQCWVGVLNKEETNKITEFQKIILSSRRKTLMPTEQVSFFDKVQSRVDATVLFSGLIARFRFTGTNLPNDVLLMERYGSEITLFEDSLNYWFSRRHLPIFKSVFEKQFQQSYNEEELRKGSLYNIVLHELAHTFMRYRDSEKRLGNLFPAIDEIGASVMGIKVCGSLLIKDVISQKDLEHIMVMFIVRLFDWLNDLEKDPSMIHYIKGNAVALNFLISSGALKLAGGISWPNFTKMFVAIDELASVLDRILSMGSQKDAERFIETYGSLDIFNDYKKTLKKIK